MEAEVHGVIVKSVPRSKRIQIHSLRMEMSFYMDSKWPDLPLKVCPYCQPTVLQKEDPEYCKPLFCNQLLQWKELEREERSNGC